MKKSLLILVTLLASGFAFGQGNDYLLRYAEQDSLGEELYGYKTISGEVVIKAKYYTVVTDTMYMLAFVVDSGGWAAIDRSGQIVLYPFVFDNGPDYVSEGLFRFEENGKVGFANMLGEKIIPAAFDIVFPFKDGLASYCNGCHQKNDERGRYWVGGTMGYVNQQGQRFMLVFDAKNGFRDAYTFDGNHFLLNERGEVVKEYER